MRQASVRLRPWTLCLELTETTVMGETASARAGLHALVEAGALLAIDDFGTGFSSLSYLTRLPVHGLKVDRSFVHALGPSAPGQAVATAVTTLANALGLQCVAEGIETEQQLDILRGMGCGFGQGFLFGRPLPAEQAEQLLRSAGEGDGPVRATV